MKFGLNDDDFKILLRLAVLPLRQQGARVWVFGSRARGDHNQFSDIDLLYSTQHELPTGYLAQIIFDLEESTLPIQVELIRDQDLASSYKEHVMKDIIEIIESI